MLDLTDRGCASLLGHVSTQHCQIPMLPAPPQRLMHTHLRKLWARVRTRARTHTHARTHTNMHKQCNHTHVRIHTTHARMHTNTCTRHAIKNMCTYTQRTRTHAHMHTNTCTRHAITHACAHTQICMHAHSLPDAESSPANSWGGVGERKSAGGEGNACCCLKGRVCLIIGVRGGVL